MKIIRDKTTCEVIYAGDHLKLTEYGVVGHDFVDVANNLSNVEIIEVDGLPDYFRGRMYTFDSGEWKGKAEYLQQVARDIVSKKIIEIDSAVSSASADYNVFEFEGNNYYADFKTITGYFAAIPYLPEDFSILWKTADKESDGINNIEVTLDKVGLRGLGLAYMSYMSFVWKSGEQIKKQIKNMLVEQKTPEEISSISTGVIAEATINNITED